MKYLCWSEANGETEADGEEIGEEIGASSPGQAARMWLRHYDSEGGDGVTEEQDAHRVSVRAPDGTVTVWACWAELHPDYYSREVTK